MMTMRKILVCAFLLLFLAGCVPAPEPDLSPMPQPFSSVLAPPRVYHYYAPLAGGTPGKLGLAQDLQGRNCAVLDQFDALWHYDWSPYPLDCPGVEAVPMLWSPGVVVAKNLPAGQYLLVGNECDLANQCNTSPEVAAVWWRQVEQLYPERKLIGPNASYLGLDWLLAWHAAYSKLYGEPPRMWALGIHCYAVPDACRVWTETNIALAQQWTTSGKVWVTEWAMRGLPDANTFMNWLLAQDDVERAAWFLAQDAGRLNETGLLGPTQKMSKYGFWYSAKMAQMAGD
jgi:hypothetical protein